MATQYFRITGYCPEKNFSFIMDCNGRHEKMWQFSAEVVDKGIKILYVGNDEKFLDVNIPKVEEDNEKLILRAYMDGMPIETEQEIDGIVYKAVKVNNKIYVPDRNVTL